MILYGNDITYGNAIGIVLRQMLCAIILKVIASLIFKKGLNRYEAMGG